MSESIEKLKVEIEADPAPLRSGLAEALCGIRTTLAALVPVLQEIQNVMSSNTAGLKACVPAMNQLFEGQKELARLQLSNLNAILDLKKQVGRLARRLERGF